MNQNVLEQMKALRLYGMHRAFTTTLCSDSIPYTNDELKAHINKARRVVSLRAIMP